PGKRIYIGIEDRFMHVEALDGAATLSVVVKRAVRCGGSHGSDITHIIRYVQRIFAAQFALTRHHLVGYTFIEVTSCLVGARKEISVKGHIEQGFACVAASCSKLKGPWWHTRFLQESLNLKPRQRGMLGGFVHHRVTRQQGRHKYIYAHQPRIIPGGDVAHYAQRLIAD